MKIEITKSGSIMNKINGVEIKGRLCIDDNDVWAMFSKYVSMGESYIETGCLFGGSLIIAGLSCDGPLHTIDPLDGYYQKGRRDISTQLIPTPEIVLENVSKFFNPERVTIHQQKSDPWPKTLKGMRFDVGFIDGDHTYEGCKSDWRNMRRCINKYVILDNIDHKAIQRVVNEMIKWEFVERVGNQGVWRKPK